jgi:hypothetical protein
MSRIRARYRPIVQWRTSDGASIAVGEAKVTPQSRALVVRLPFGGFVWNRPAAVLVERRGQTQRVPIVDVTRRLLWAMMALTALLWLMGRRSNRRLVIGE